MTFEVKSSWLRLKRVLTGRSPRARRLVADLLAPWHPHARIAALETQVVSLTRQVHQHESHMASLAEEATRRQHERIAFDEACLERFRGHHEVIKDRFRYWLPVIQSIRGTGLEGLRAVDLGSGRGEWLELLKEQQVHAVGIDASARNQAGCRERGLNVTCGDLLAWLEAAPVASCDIITAFHILEHLEVSEQHMFFRECLRVLAPRGVLVIETPNPENVAVGAHYFYLDPSHQRPLPPGLATLLAEYHGFAEIAIHRLQPVMAAELLPVPVEPWHIGFLGSQDFGLVAVKPLVPSSHGGR